MEKENVSKQKQLSCMLSLPKKEKKSSYLFLESGSAGMFPDKGVWDGWELANHLRAVW
jgi:hypothetical protein